MRLLGFPGNRVPALKIDGRKVQGSRDVSRELDALQPDPPLFPADPERRAAVEEAERWGDEEFQQMPRTISWWALKRHKSDQASFLADAGPMARLGMPTRIAVATSGPILRIAIRLNDSTDETVRSTLAAIGPALDKVDRLIAEGVIGGDQPNAADFQIASERRAADGRSRTCGQRSRTGPAAELARRLYPWYPGHVRPSFPPEWLAAAARSRATHLGHSDSRIPRPAPNVAAHGTRSSSNARWSSRRPSSGTRSLGRRPQPLARRGARERADPPAPPRVGRSRLGRRDRARGLGLGNAGPRRGDGQRAPMGARPGARARLEAVARGAARPPRRPSSLKRG